MLEDNKKTLIEKILKFNFDKISEII